MPPADAAVQRQCRRARGVAGGPARRRLPSHGAGTTRRRARAAPPRPEPEAAPPGPRPAPRCGAWRAGWRRQGQSRRRRRLPNAHRRQPGGRWRGHEEPSGRGGRTPTAPEPRSDGSGAEPRGQPSEWLFSHGAGSRTPERRTPPTPPPSRRPSRGRSPPPDPDAYATAHPSPGTPQLLFLVALAHAGTLSRMTSSRRLRLRAVILSATCVLGVTVGIGGVGHDHRSVTRDPVVATGGLPSAASPAVLPARTSHQLRAATQFIPLRTLLVGVLPGLIVLPAALWRWSIRAGRAQRAPLARRRTISLRAPPPLLRLA